MAFLIVLLLLSSWITELIGIHALFGSFLFGGILPRDRGFAHALARRLEDLVVVVLLPLFFASSGLHTRIGLLASGRDWMVCGLVVIMALVTTCLAAPLLRIVAVPCTGSAKTR